MAEFLTFALVAPLGAMGALAVGERRGGWDRPARSAVLGLVAGCLGIERTEEAAHAALSAGFGLAIRRFGQATPVLSDYHTAQTRPTRRNVVFATRAEELADKRELETVLSRREYRMDIAFIVALWPRAEGLRWTLDDLAEALRHPVFVPYLGRKSCPLGLPMAPITLQADTLQAAFAARDAQMSRPERDMMPPGNATIWADHDAEKFGLQAGHTEQRRDELASRGRWQFGLRTELVAAWPAKAGGGP
jgi:CRISPR system Cascade subunit CasD